MSDEVDAEGGAEGSEVETPAADEGVVVTPPADDGSADEIVQPSEGEPDATEGE